jgi:hypothetical protein
MRGGGRNSSRTSGVRRTLCEIGYAAQASVLACEEGIVLHETISALTSGQWLIQLSFKRRASAAASPARFEFNPTARPRRRHGRPALGIQEGHLKRRIILRR